MFAARNSAASLGRKGGEGERSELTGHHGQENPTTPRGGRRKMCLQVWMLRGGFSTSMLQAMSLLPAQYHGDQNRRQTTANEGGGLSVFSKNYADRFGRKNNHHITGLLGGFEGP